MIALTDIQEAAKQFAGNWQDFDCFVWFRASELKDAEKWAVIYTHNRDSGILDQSNGEVIRKALEPFSEGDNPDVEFESHSHWAVGHVTGFSIRVYRRGRITKAFRKYYELHERMENYPILDETDYSNREYEATLQNIELAAWTLKREFTLPEDWVSQVYDWLSENDSLQLENCDDRGGWPDDDALRAAFDALKFEPIAE